MPQTARMQWPYAARGESPFYSSYENQLAAQDASGYAAREDRNLTLAAGGTFAFNAATGVLSWSAALEIISPHTGVIVTVPAGMVTMIEGRFAWVDLPRGPTASVALAVATGSTLPSGDGYLLLFVRRTNRVYVRGAKVLNDGDSIALFTSSGGAPALPALPTANLWVGNALNVATAVPMSGDVGINLAGSTTIANNAITTPKILNNAVTSAKIDLTNSFDFASAAGLVLVNNPALPTEAANKQWTEALVSASQQRTTPLTVWVAQGSPEAEDAPRTGIDPNRWDVPFLSLTAACAAISAFPLTGVTLYVLDGYYDESVSVPDGVNIVCLGAVYITRLVFTSGGFNTLHRARMYNDGVSVAPDTTPIEVGNSTTLKMYDVIAEDYLQGSLGADPAMLQINNAVVEAFNCKLYSFNLTGGAGAGAVRAAVVFSGAGVGSFTAHDCTLIGSTNVDNESACGIQLTNSHASSRVRIIGGVVRGIVQHLTPTGHVAGVLITSGWTGQAEVICAHIQFGSTSGVSGPTSQSPARNEAGGTLNLLNCTIHCDGATAVNQGAGASTVVGAVLRILGAVWAYRSTIPARQGATLGTFVHEGVLQDGRKFPMGIARFKLSPAKTTNGTLGVVATAEINTILPSDYGENPYREFRFAAVLFTSNAALSMTARLINVTPASPGFGQIVAAVSTTSTSPVRVVSSALVIGTGVTDLQTTETAYEVQIELAAGAITDIGDMGGAWLEVV